MTHHLTEDQRIVAALANGPRRVADIVELTDIPSGSVSRTCQRLMVRGAVRRLNPGHTRAIYALAGDPTKLKPAWRGAVVRAMEDRYVDLRTSGETAISAADALGLSASTLESFEKLYRAQSTSHNMPDSTCPKWFNDEKHIDGVFLAGGYPVLSERRGPKGRCVTCLPVIYPGAVAQVAA